MLSKLKIALADAFVSFADSMNNKAENYRFKPFFCPVCQQPIRQYLPYNNFNRSIDNLNQVSPFFTETFNFQQYWCSNCMANDRDRLYALYFRKEFGKLDKSKKYKFIDFAPETGSLANYIKSQPFLEYRSADLFMPNVDDTVDLQDMKVYGDNTVDYFICSHMLEHVPDDRKAMSELYRILKPGGKGIAMVPIDLNREDVLEDPTISDENERWRLFGQNDHVRLYSKQGFTQRLKDTGFKLTELDKKYFGEETFTKAGIYPRSVLYIVEK
jgi:SAM-dependent methyltransferase